MLVSDGCAASRPCRRDAQTSVRSVRRVGAQAAAASSIRRAIHRRPGLGILRPITSPPVRLGHVGPDTHGVQVDQGLIAVIPLITDDLFQRLPIVNVGLRVFDLLGRGDGGLDDRRGVADIGTLQCRALGR